MKEITQGDYFKEIERMIGQNQDVLGFFHGHYHRFALTFDMFKRNLSSHEIRSVADIGTWTPFSSLYFAIAHDAKVTCFCPPSDERYIVQDERASHVDFNLNFPTDTGLHDLVICTECLEHLPSSVTKALSFLWSQVKPGGFLFVSCPCGGINAKDYELDLGGYDYNVAHGHIREFTQDTADRLLGALGGKLIDKAGCQTDLYHAMIFHYLIQKEANA
jgi:SAM-dependent methyltransferase